MSDRPDWLSITMYAATYGVSRPTVWKWLGSGLLTYYRVGRVIRIKDHPPLSTSDQQDGLKAINPVR
jgi:excisionase family DNA binding protein